MNNQQSLNSVNSSRYNMQKSRQGQGQNSNGNINNNYSHYSIMSNSRQKQINSFSKVSNQDYQNQKIRQQFILQQGQAYNSNKNKFLKNSRDSHYQTINLQPESRSSRQYKYNKNNQYIQNSNMVNHVHSYPQHIYQAHYQEQIFKAPQHVYSRVLTIQDYQMVNTQHNHATHITSIPQYKITNDDQNIYGNYIISIPQYKNVKDKAIYRSRIMSKPQYILRYERNKNRLSRVKLSNYSPNNHYHKSSKEYFPNSYNNSQNSIKYLQSQPKYIVSQKDFKRDDHYLRSHSHINGQYLTQDLKLAYKLTARSFDPQYVDHGLQLLFQEYGTINRQKYGNKSNNEQLMIDKNGMERIMNDMYANLGINIKVSKQEVQDYMKRMQKFDSRLNDGKIDKFQMKKVVNNTHILYDPLIGLGNIILEPKQYENKKY